MCILNAHKLSSTCIFYSILFSHKLNGDFQLQISVKTSNCISNKIWHDVGVQYHEHSYRSKYFLVIITPVEHYAHFPLPAIGKVNDLSKRFRMWPPKNPLIKHCALQFMDSAELRSPYQFSWAARLRFHILCNI